MKHFRTRWAVLLISIIFLSSCGGSNTSPSATPLTPEGIITPVLLTANNITSLQPGTVGNTATGNKSYYRVIGVSPSTPYTITLYGLSADADLLVYNDFPFDSFPANQPNQITSNGGCVSQYGGTANEQCTITANSSGTMNIEVDGQYSLSGATYFISVNSPTLSAVACPNGTGCTSFDTPGSIPTGFVLTQTGGGDVWDTDCSISATGGGCSMHSGFIAGLTSPLSCVSYTAATTSTTAPYVSFNLKVTPTTPYVDQLQFYIDNVLQTPVWSVTVSWQNVMFNTVSGTHTYKWCHSYTGTSAIGAVWVDDIYIQ